MSSPVVLARSFLFVPASSPERFVKALGSSADCVILDLEDAVALDQKDEARESLARGLADFSSEQLARTLVRINASDSSWHGADLKGVAPWIGQGLAGVMVPKASSAASLQTIALTLGAYAQLVPLVESLEGLDAVDALAVAPQVVRLAFGHLDFQLDLGMSCTLDEIELMSVRFALVAASRRAQLNAPIDGVTVDTSNEILLQADSQRARAFGFGAKLCIHPAQTGLVNAAFSPSQTELEWARRVVEAAGTHGGRAFSLGGKMVDLPVVRLAKQALAKAGIDSD